MKRIGGAVLSAFVILAAPLRADAATPLDTMFPGTKVLESHDWNVKANAVVQWKQMLDRFSQQQASCQPADGCAKFKALVETLGALSLSDQIKAVGRAERAIAYKEDIHTAGKPDFWATPYETLSANSGDTEDYAILGYEALRAAGVPASALRVLAVRLVALGGVGHAVLAVDTTPEPLILDNRVPVAMGASKLGKEMKPVLSLNEDGWWYYTGTAQ